MVSEPEEIWEPMATAPLDGTPVRLRKDDSVATVSWSTEIGTWVFGIATQPNIPRAHFALASKVLGTCSWDLGIEHQRTKSIPALR